MGLLSIFRGLTRKFLIKLELYGRGFRVFFFNQSLYFKLGFSHFIKYQVSNFLQIFIIKKLYFCIFSINLRLLTQICVDLLRLRYIDIYKGKGLKVLKKNIILKIGKKE